MFDWLGKLIFQIVNMINNLTYGLALSILSDILPGLGPIVDNMTLFFNNYVWQMLYFVKKVFTNILLFPPQLFHTIALFYASVLLIRTSLKIYMGCVNVYSLLKNGRSSIVPPAPEERKQITDYYVE